MPEFIQGLELSERYYREVVGPILSRDFPGMRYAAALIGSGSEVPGFDTPQSTDHHWGPRLMLFLPEEGFATRKAQVDGTLRIRLPYTFLGYPTSFGEPDAIGVRLMKEVEWGPVDHMIDIFTVRSFFKMYLGIDANSEIGALDWLTFPEHRLLGSTSGKVFHDTVGELTAVRKRLEYYPRDVWLYMLAAQWAKISQEEAFVGRTGDVGDELGSRIIAARLVQYLMRLCFLMERSYAPYSKWLGTAFAQLSVAEELIPLFQGVLEARSWQERERALSEAYRIVAEKHNSLGITGPLAAEVTLYHERPYRVIHADRFAEAIRAAIAEPEVKELTPLLGSVNQFVDSTDVVERLEVCRKLRAAYKTASKQNGAAKKA